MQSLGMSFWRKAYITHAAMKEKEELARLRVLRLEVQMFTNPDLPAPLPPEEAGNSLDSQSTHASTDAASREQPGASAEEEGKGVEDTSACFSWMNKRSSKFYWAFGCVLPPHSLPAIPSSLPDIPCASVALTIPSRMSLFSRQFERLFPRIRADVQLTAYLRVEVPHELPRKPVRSCRD